MKSKKSVYDRKSVHSIVQVLSKQIDPSGGKCKSNKIDFDGDLINMDSHRYWLFKYKGVSCASCGLKGEYFAKERAGNVVSYHFNLYGLNENNEEVLFTKYKIIPKKEGGKNNLENYIVMCNECNCKRDKGENK